MYYKLSFLVFVLFIASCKKEETPEPKPAVQYDIYVNDWNPGLIPGWYSYNPLDIIGDGQTDLKLSFYGDVQWYDSSGYDVYFISHYDVLELVDTTFKIATYNDTINYNLFTTNELIQPSVKWEKGVILYGKRWWDHSNSNSNVEYYSYPFEVNNGDGYLALKREINGDVYYGWIHANVKPDTVTFYESGFNKIPNVPIQIGQTQ